MNIIYGSASYTDFYHKKKEFNLQRKEKIKILKNLKKIKINKIDTSPDYGDAEKLIGLFCHESIEIDSKLPQIAHNIDKYKLGYLIQKKVEKTLENLKDKKIDIYYFHDPKILLSSNGEKIFQIIENIKKDKYIKKIGISIYDPIILKKILKNFDIDAVQAPLNIFDNRILKNNYINFLKRKRIKLIVRSVYLQGLLINKKLRYKIKDPKIQKLLNNWYNFLKINKLNAMNECLNFVKMKKIKNIIIGANTYKELKELSNIKYKTNINLNKFRTNNKKLIDPFRWKF